MSAFTKKVTHDNIVLNEGDGWYYVDDVKITGVAVRRTQQGKTIVYTENRVAMTKNEQTKLGSKQPYMIPQSAFGTENFITYQDAKDALWEHITQKCREVSAEKGPRDAVALMRGMCNPYSEEHPVEWIVPNDKLVAKEMIYWASVMRQTLYKKRHFLMPILREALKQNEHPTAGLVRLLKEECREDIKSGVSIDHIKFAYFRSSSRGDTAMLVYDVDSSKVEPSIEAINQKGKSNYFCAKAIPYFGNNDFLETKDPVIMETDKVSEMLEQFANTYGENGLGCDLSRWGADKLWGESLKYM